MAKRGRISGDPVGSEKPRGKRRNQRKGRYDAGWTPSEQRTKDRLMRQFIKGYDGPRGNSEAYVNSPCWCEHPGCTRLKWSDRYCNNHALKMAYAR